MAKKIAKTKLVARAVPTGVKVNNANPPQTLGATFKLSAKPKANG